MAPTADGKFHAEAAAGNAAAADAAIATLIDALDGTAPVDRVLLKAAAGAGKSYALRRMVKEAIEDGRATRVAVVAFTNKQIHPLAVSLGKELGKDNVCIFVKKGSRDHSPRRRPQVRDRRGDHPRDPDQRPRRDRDLPQARRAGRVRTPAHLPGQRPQRIDPLRRAVRRRGVADPAPPLRQGPRHRAPLGGGGRRRPAAAARDRQQPLARRREVQPLPRLAHRVRRRRPHLVDGSCPPSGDRRPATSRLWRAFYPEWAELNCVAAPGDRGIELGDGLSDVARAVWEQVGTGVPTLLEVDGLPAPEAADIDLPLRGARRRPPRRAVHRRVHPRRRRPRRRRPHRRDDPPAPGRRSRRSAGRRARHPQPGRRRRGRRGGAAGQEARPHREGPAQLDRRLLPGPDQRHHGRRAPAHRRRRARRVQLRLRPPRRHLHPRHPRPADGHPTRARHPARRGPRQVRARRTASPATGSSPARPTNASSPRSPVAP